MAMTKLSRKLQYSRSFTSTNAIKLDVKIADLEETVYIKYGNRRGESCSLALLTWIPVEGDAIQSKKDKRD